MKNSGDKREKLECNIFSLSSIVWNVKYPTLAKQIFTRPWFNNSEDSVFISNHRKPSEGITILVILFCFVSLSLYIVRGRILLNAKYTQLFKIKRRLKSGLFINVVCTLCRAKRKIFFGFWIFFFERLFFCSRVLCVLFYCFFHLDSFSKCKRKKEGRKTVLKVSPFILSGYSNSRDILEVFIHYS